MGAGILVAAPVRPVALELPDPVAAVRSASVELSAAVSPLVAQPSAASIPVLPDPGALLAVAQAFVAQFGEGLKQAPGLLQQAIQEVLAGQITQALNTAANIVLTPVTGPVLDAIFSGSGPLVDLVDVLQPSLAFFPPLANVLGLLKNPDFLLTVGLGPLQSIYSINTVIGGAAETVLKAAQAGDLSGVVNGVIKGLVDFQGTVVTQLFAAGTGPYYYDRGLIGSLIAAGQMIVDAITAPPATATAAVQTAAKVETVAPEALSAAPEKVTATEATSAASAADEAGTAAEDAATATEVKTTTEVKPATEVNATDEVKATAEPEVRTGIVAVPGKGVVSAPADKDESVTTAAQTDSTTASAPATDASTKSDAASTTSAKSDGATSGGAESGSNAGGSNGE